MCLSALRSTIKIHPETDTHYLDTIKEVYCQGRGEDNKSSIYLNRNIGQHLKKLGFIKKRDGTGTYIIADDSIFDGIVSPICPQLVFISTLSTLSTLLPIKEENKEKNSVDVVKMNVDKEIK